MFTHVTLSLRDADRGCSVCGGGVGGGRRRGRGSMRQPLWVESDSKTLNVGVCLLSDSASAAAAQTTCECVRVCVCMCLLFFSTCVLPILSRCESLSSCTCSRSRSERASDASRRQQRRRLIFPAFAAARDSRSHASLWEERESLSRRGPHPWVGVWLLSLRSLSRIQVDKPRR